MSYSILKAPFELNFKEMKRERAYEYLEWFIKQIPERIPVLTRHLKQSQKYSSWNGDMSPGSLDLLGKWFCENVELRSRSSEEMSTLNLPTWLQPIAQIETVLTTMTMNFVIDISMYFGQALITNNPSLHWDLVTKPKNNADYQQPVVFDRSKRYVNPIRIIRVYAYEIADKSQGPDRLGELYRIWSNTLSE
jgi:hypothetical protein